jgi:hypothetical protein
VKRAVLLAALAAAPAFAADEELAEEAARAADSNIEASLRRAPRDAERAAAHAAVLLASCEGRLRRAARLGRPRGAAEDADGPAEQLALAAELLGQKTAAFRRESARAGLTIPADAAAELALKRLRYRARDREGDLRLAEGDFARALKRLGKPGVALDSKLEAPLSALRSALTEFRRGREGAAALAGKPPAAAWKDVLDGLGQDASDLARELRLLELAASLKKVDELSFDLPGR